MLRKYLIIAVILMVTLGTARVSYAATPSAGDLVKLTCPTNAPGNHPCRAVYFLGADGKRHAFPNVAVYNSWYIDWTGIKSVDAPTLANLSLGKNVRWRPGARPVKFMTSPTVYVVDDGPILRPIPSEEIAHALYGADWTQKVADMPDAFATDYAIGEAITTASVFNPAARLAANPTIDSLAGSSYQYRRIATAAGDFDAHVVALDRSKFRMQTKVAATTDCSDDCPAKSLADHALAVRATIGINGAYFCPPDYADCANQTNTFLWPEFDSTTREMRNADRIKYHDGAMAIATTAGRLILYRDARSFNSVNMFEVANQATLDAAIANYPSLVANGANIVGEESRMDDKQRTVKGTRAGLGWDAKYFYLVVTKAATVTELAAVMKAVGATDAMNLDGGGSTALLYGGTYKVGPGRLLPTAILFVAR